MPGDSRTLKTEPVFDERGKLIGRECDLLSLREAELQAWAGMLISAQAALRYVEAAEHHLEDLGTADAATKARIWLNDVHIKLVAVVAEAGSRKCASREEVSGG